MPTIHLCCFYHILLVLICGLLHNSQANDQYKCNRERLCLSKCRINISLDEPSWTIPSTCERKKTNGNCAVLMQIDFQQRQIDIFLTHDIRLNLNQTMNQMIIQLLQFEFKSQSIQHYIGYICTQGDDCHWLFVQDKIPSILKVEYYQQFYDELAPLLYQRSLETKMTTCYQNNRLVDCSNRICSYGPAFGSGVLSMSRHCSQENETNVGIQIERRRSDSPVPAYTRDLFRFLCNRNRCNSPKNEARINITIQNYTQWIISIDKNASSHRLETTLTIFLFLIFTTLYYSY